LRRAPGGRRRADDAAYPGRDKPCGQEAKGHAGDHGCERPARVVGDRVRQHGEEVVGRPPGEDLRNAQRCDDHAETGGSCHALIPLPQPDLGPHAATCVGMQQLLAAVGAGVPQHALTIAPSASIVTVQTRLSGNTSWMLRAPRAPVPVSIRFSDVPRNIVFTSPRGDLSTMVREISKEGRGDLHMIVISPAATPRKVEMVPAASA
jgi:hypothetical protein